MENTGDDEYDDEDELDSISPVVIDLLDGGDESESELSLIQVYAPILNFETEGQLQLYPPSAASKLKPRAEIEVSTSSNHGTQNIDQLPQRVSISNIK